MDGNEFRNSTRASTNITTELSDEKQRGLVRARYPQTVETKQEKRLINSAVAHSVDRMRHVYRQEIIRSFCDMSSLSRNVISV